MEQAMLRITTHHSGIDQTHRHDEEVLNLDDCVQGANHRNLSKGPVEDVVLRIKQDYEERLRRQNEEHQRAIEEHEALSYSIAHDLRAPLRALSSLVERLAGEQTGSSSPVSTHTLDAIKESTEKMQTLIEDLLEFSRIGCRNHKRAEIDMTELVRSVLDDLLNEGHASSVTVFIEPLHPVFADAAMIRQVWINLISNALKFTRTKSSRHIKITSRASGSETVFCVSDNGVGFDMHYAGKLFRVFQRLHCEEEFEGTGVGLAIVHRIIQSHGGRVWAESIEDNGASFYFTLPRTTFTAGSGRN
jgi:light-regulated signal transduction histidine kinase (bacteriophytochrome)